MKKHRITGLIGTLVLHVLILVFLLLVAISKPKMQEEGGVPVMLGNMEIAQTASSQLHYSTTTTALDSYFVGGFLLKFVLVRFWTVWTF